MDRQAVQKMFEKIDSRVTIRTGTRLRFDTNPLSVNVVTDKKGEHFTITISPNVNEDKIFIQCLDVDVKLKQMLLLIRYTAAITSRTNITREEDRTERLLVGHDEMHWFVAGVTASTSIEQAFRNLRPVAVTQILREKHISVKDGMKRKNKGFIRQGEWFFVPVEYNITKNTIIHKNEPIQRNPRSTPHMVEELIREGGTTVYVGRLTSLTKSEYSKLSAQEQKYYTPRIQNARVFARGKIRHSDHHTIELNGWHEVHLSTEVGNSSNAFID